MSATVRGRVRLRVPRLYRDDRVAARLRERLGLWPGVVRIKANPLTATLLVLFDADRIGEPDVVKAVRQSLRRNSTVVSGSAPGQAKVWHRLGTAELERALGSSAAAGLGEGEAARRVARSGPNALRPPERRTSAEMLVSQFSNLPSALLLGSTVLSLATGGLVDAAAIFAVVMINGYIGYRTESSAERAISELTAPGQLSATVVRDGRVETRPVEEVAPGDLVLLRPGTMVPADARIVDAEHLSVDESMLTGESLPVSKLAAPLRGHELALGDRANMVFRGTVVTGGSGRALVTATGESTEIGSIQRLIFESQAPDTPLQLQLSYLGHRMALLSIGVSGITLLAGLLRGFGLLRMLKTAVSLAIAAIPESLPTIATTTLARSIRSLSREGVHIRRLDAIETLGGVDVICFDKTGTLTMNQMSAVALATAAGELAVSETTLGGAAREARELARVAALCNEGGSPTERALLELASLFGLDTRRLRRRFPTLATRYRSEQGTFMRTTHRGPGGRTLYAVKGRPEDVLSLCSSVMRGGRVVRLSAAGKRALRKRNEEMARRGLRVLSFAMSEHDPQQLTWLGLVGLRDELRQGLRKVVERLRRARIRTIMITGDQAPTALSIGRRLGLEVFARVSPSKKLEIIRELQSARQVVAMVGDGINDGPALKAADVGIAMGANGTEVASQVADIVLANDDLAKLIPAVREGRMVQDDIKKAVSYILTQNVAEVLFTFLSIAFGLGEPLSPMQLLWMNLLTDIFPELALAREPAEKGLLKRPSMHAEEQLLLRRDLRRMGYESAILTAAALAGYLYATRRYSAGPRARTVGFVTLVSGSLLYTLSARSERQSIFDGQPYPPNRAIPAAIGAGFVAEAAGVFLPGVATALGSTPIGAGDLLVSALGSIVPFLAIETLKFLNTHAPREAWAA